MPDDATPKSLLLQLQRAVAICEADLATELRRAGISQEEWRLLEVLADGTGRTMSDLSGAAVSAPATATRIVDKLVSRAWAYRRVDVADRRRVVVYLSARGTRSIEPVLVAVAASRSRLESGIGARRWAALLDGLTRIDELDARSSPEAVGRR